ncbi:prenyltransferase [Microbacterium faecale]|uniref:Prenyltransferase n=1 Tax=Microbacterium faecale TaxID=1804630 RepID=A0A917DH62_9MICO|nr:prenyltransferase [Microbacterium faecale]GGD40196.1 prenyltransferase [Microbacterium faecale]HJB62686.1 prenyltransferase [Candidatus Microbacterium pullistercoris]
MAERRSLIRTLLVASRPLSWINTAYPFAAVYVLTTGRIDLSFVVGTIFFLVPYNLVMYGVNDVFDYESDLANPRKGGAEGAKLPPRLHRATLVSATGLALPFVVTLVVLGTQRPMSWAVLAVSLFAVLAYSLRGLRFKEIPVLDSVTSSTHFVTPALYALALAGTVITPAIALTMIAFFCWGMASHAFGAVQDIVPDRDAAIGSIATVFGAAATVRIAIALWAIAGILMLFSPWPANLAAIAALPYIISVAPYLNVDDAHSGTANRAWRRFLAINYAVGFAVTLLLIFCVTEGLFS